MGLELDLNITALNTNALNANDNFTDFCGGASDEELEWFNKFSYWTEGVTQLVLGKSCNTKS